MTPTDPGPLDRTDLSMALAAIHYFIRAWELGRRPVPPAAHRLAAHLEAAMSFHGPEPVVPQQDLLTTAQAAQRLDCTARHIRRIAPQIGGRRIGRQWLIPADSLPTPEDP